jgi:hypothetical protein
VSDLNDDWETWKRETANRIFAASIALQARDYMADGRGGVTPEVMKRIAEEAAAISEVWEEMVEPSLAASRRQALEEVA